MSAMSFVCIWPASPGIKCIFVILVIRWRRRRSGGQQWTFMHNNHNHEMRSARFRTRSHEWNGKFTTLFSQSHISHSYSHCCRRGAIKMFLRHRVVPARCDAQRCERKKESACVWMGSLFTHQTRWNKTNAHSVDDVFIAAKRKLLQFPSALRPFCSVCRAINLAFISAAQTILWIGKRRRQSRQRQWRAENIISYEIIISLSSRRVRENIFSASATCNLKEI